MYCNEHTKPISPAWTFMSSVINGLGMWASTHTVTTLGHCSNVGCDNRIEVRR